MRCPFIVACCLVAAVGCSSSSGGDDPENDQQQYNDVMDGQSLDQSRLSDSIIGQDQTTDEQHLTDNLDAAIDSEPTDGTLPDTCDCGDWVCGSPEPGCQCGSCPQGQDCVQGTCQAPQQSGELGSYCGVTAGCPGTVEDSETGEQVFNPDFSTCANAQCDSQFCLMAGTTGVFLDIPACSQPCSIYLDEVNNQTGAAGPDGIEDPDSPFSDCTGFTDGPAGENWVCVNFSGPWDSEVLAYCVPGTSFNYCSSDADCATEEQCMFSTISAEYTSRCVARLQETTSNNTAKLAEACNEYPTDGLPTFCESGWCFGMGCVSYCESDADCDTTKLIPNSGCDTTSGTCKNWPQKSCAQDIDCSAWECGSGYQIFADLPSYTPRLCWPKTGCETDADCPSNFYCSWNYEGATVPGTDLPSWSNMCVPQTAGGAEAGEACGPATSCKNSLLCMEGHCAALCSTDSDCGLDQLCTITEFTLDYDEDGAMDQVLPLGLCTNHVGSLTSCFANTSCPDDEYCNLLVVDNPTDDPDSPHFASGVCETTDVSRAGQGEPCFYGSDCQSGWCINADPDANSSGYCTQLCERATDCPSITFADNTTYEGLCNRYTYSYGGDTRVIETNIYVGLCIYTASTISDCSGDLTCGAYESCTVFGTTFDPPYTPNLDYLCLSTQNTDSSYPTKLIGQSCNPWAEDSEGYSLEECMSGLCLEDVSMGYCSALCTPGAGDCGGGGPDMACLPLTLVPRRGQYEANSLSWYACRKDIDCTPCGHTTFCPGNRSCVNLGQDSGTLADYRCVKSCTTNSDCAGETVTTCNPSADAFGNATMGCFEMGSAFPVNHCMY